MDKKHAISKPSNNGQRECRELTKQKWTRGMPRVHQAKWTKGVAQANQTRVDTRTHEQARHKGMPPRKLTKGTRQTNEAKVNKRNATSKPNLSRQKHVENKCAKEMKALGREDCDKLFVALSIFCRREFPIEATKHIENPQGEQVCTTECRAWCVAA